MLNFKLQVTPAADAKGGVNPLPQEPCIFKANTTSNKKSASSNRFPIDVRIYIYMFDRCDDKKFVSIDDREMCGDIVL